jgi:hypothetical protein
MEMITDPKYLSMITMMILQWKTNKLEFLGKIQFLRYDVNEWRHNVKIFVDLESTYKDLLYDVQHDMVPNGSFDFKIWPWGKQISTRSETHEGQRRSAPKIN